MKMNVQALIALFMVNTVSCIKEAEQAAIIPPTTVPAVVDGPYMYSCPEVFNYSEQDNSMKFYLSANASGDPWIATKVSGMKAQYSEDAVTFTIEAFTESSFFEVRRLKVRTIGVAHVYIKYVSVDGMGYENVLYETQRPVDPSRWRKIKVKQSVRVEGVSYVAITFVKDEGANNMVIHRLNMRVCGDFMVQRK